ncbi:MAG: hypothetical protein HQK79_14910 [Desulfobacterales bacterium]|nr:hypothetical protein [Desulfobacterales bacterium]
MKKLTYSQIKDTGLLVVLILLLIIYFNKQYYLIQYAIAALLLTIVYPSFFKLLAYIWIGFSNKLGSITSKISLTIIFLFVVTPVGLIRRAANRDSMQLKLWKKGKESTLIERNILFSEKDFKRPF